MKKIYHIPIEENFIKTFVHFFLMPVKKDYSDTAVVFPNKRPFLFLHKELARQIGSSFIPARNFTMDEFIYYIFEKKYSDFKQINFIDTIWIIYNILQENNIKIRGFDFSFDEFLPWGEKIFKFINQLDTENIESQKLNAIEENAELGYDVPEQINDILHNILFIRQRLHNFLEKNRLFTRGYAYLKAMEILNSAEINEFKKIYFAGLFALTRVEQQIIKKFWEDYNAEIIWNGDYKSWKKILGELKNVFNPAEIEKLTLNKKNNEPDIKLYSAFDVHSEVVRSFEILSEMDIKNTAIILPVADTLFPLLSLVVDRLKKINKIDTFNISLQYPLIRTSLFSLINKILEIQKFVRIRADGTYYNSKLYVNILSHPFIKNLSKNEFIITREFIRFVSDSLKGNKKNKFTGKIYIKLQEVEGSDELLDYLDSQFKEFDRGEIKSSIEKIHSIIFENFESIRTISEAVEQIAKFLDLIVKYSNVRSYVLSGEIFNLLFEQIDEMKSLLFADEPFNTGKEFIINFILSNLQNQTISFSTTPLQDLEIIGMLETRNLNFDNVIILDLQDSVLPGEKKIDPLIPLDLYKQLNLPDYDKQEEMNRYYFERIIKSAENVHILYVEDENKIKSRYVEKIIWEKEKRVKKLNAYKIKKINFPINTINIEEPSLEIKKDTKILSQIENIIFSATIIDTYINCGLKFYFKYILNLEEQGKISEEIDGGDRGTIVHLILKRTYATAKKQHNYFSAERYNEIKDILFSEIENEFMHHPTTGEFYILKKIVELKLQNFLKDDLNRDGFSIYGLEKKFTPEITINDKKMNFKGFIDRIDEVNGEYVIIDYKTGSSNYYSKVNKIYEFDLNNMDEINKHIVSVQLPLYIILFEKELNKNLNVIANAEYKFFTGDRKKINLFGKSNKEDIYKYYMKIITTVVNDISDKDKPFRKWQNTDCSDCIFKDLCTTV